MNIEPKDDFDEEFYEIVCPEVKGYYEGSQYSKRERYFHHYLKYGQHFYKNREDAENKLFGNIETEEDFDKDFYEKSRPKVKEYMMWLGDWVGELSKRKRYFHHYLKFKGYKNIQDAENKLFGTINVPDNFDENFYENKHPEIKQYMMWMGDWINELSKRKRYYYHYLKYCVPVYTTSWLIENKKQINKSLIENTKQINKSLIEIQKTYSDHKNSIVLVNHVSNPYGATNYLLSLFKILKNKGLKVCLLDEVFNEQLYSKFNIDTKDVISYEKNLLLLCYIYEKLKPKIFYLNSISEIFIHFAKLNNPNVLIHSHEIAKHYTKNNIKPNYVVSKRIQKEFKNQDNHKPKIQPPIFLNETLELIDKEFKQELPKVSNHKGDIDNYKITIGMCGQTETRKNPELFKEISKLYPEYNFLWIGGEEGYFGEIDNLYHVPITQLPFIYYKLIDYFILFSQEDPCPYVVLENLYVNNKVITFKNNIYTEHKNKMIDDIYFEFNGEISIKTIQEVINDKVKHKATRIGNGKEYILQNFTKLNPDLLNKFVKENTIDYFIVCHDQDILLRSIQENKFSKLPDHTFLFVGNRSANLIEHIPNVIICNKLKHNIENYPKLCSFTAWYAVSKNLLSKNKKLCLLEYDVNLSDEFYAYHEKEIFDHINDQTVVAYFYTLTDHYVFYKSTPYLEIALKKIYGINLNNFVQKVKDQYPLWPTTTNMCMSKNVLDQFVDWFLPMTDLFREDPLGAYVHERAFFVFCVLNNIQIKYVKSPILSHNQQTSHQNLDVYGKVLDRYKTTILSQDMISDYDKIYEEAYRISLINCSK
jgi:hypothetical protein